MKKTHLIRVGASLALLSGLMWLVLSPFMVVIGLCNHNNANSCVMRPSWPLLVKTLGRFVVDYGWLKGVLGDDVYFGYGRYFFLVYALAIAGLIAFRVFEQAAEGKDSKPRNYGFRILLGSLIIACIGDFCSYGIGVFLEAAWRIGFFVEIMGIFGIIVGLLLYGFSLLSRQRFLGIVMLIAGLLIPFTFFDTLLVQYSPNTQTLPLVVAWLVMGVYVLFRQQLKQNAP